MKERQGEREDQREGGGGGGGGERLYSLACNNSPIIARME